MQLNEGAQWPELQVDSTKIEEMAVDFTENNLAYDDLLSQYITIPSSPYWSHRDSSNNDENNESLPSLTSGESCQSPMAEIFQTGIQASTVPKAK